MDQLVIIKADLTKIEIDQLQINVLLIINCFSSARLIRKFVIADVGSSLVLVYYLL